MPKIYNNFLLILLNLFISCAYAKPSIYLFLDSGPAHEYQRFLKHPAIKGAQVIYPWKVLEPEKDHYDFSQIERDLLTLNKQNKALFIQIQDKSFSPEIVNVPAYLLTNEYDGGIAEQIDFPGEGEKLTSGWVPMLWLPQVSERFQKLLIELGKEFDGKIAGINLTETSIDLDNKNLPRQFTCDNYFQSILDTMQTLKKAFPNSTVVQYVNYFPCEWNNDHQYMQTLFDYAIKNHIGLGNPDSVPYRRGQMKNSYPFFHRYKDKLSVTAIAIQEPDYTYHNPKTGKLFTAEEIYKFTNHYLGATILFWNIQQPQFSQQVIPMLNKIKGK